MPIIRTNINNTRERAGQLRYEPSVTLTDTNVQDAIETIDGIVQTLLPGALREVTVAGPVTVNASEAGIALNKAVGEATTITLPPAANRANKDVVIKDMKGDADVNNITVVPDAVDALGIDGDANDVLAISNAAQRYKPIAGGWVRI